MNSSHGNQEAIWEEEKMQKRVSVLILNFNPFTSGSQNKI